MAIILTERWHVNTFLKVSLSLSPSLSLWHKLQKGNTFLERRINHPSNIFKEHTRRVKKKNTSKTKNQVKMIDERSNTFVSTRRAVPVRFNTKQLHQF